MASQPRLEMPLVRGWNPSQHFRNVLRHRNKTNVMGPCLRKAPSHNSAGVAQEESGPWQKQARGQKTQSPWWAKSEHAEAWNPCHWATPRCPCVHMAQGCKQN
eukprot:TRINITY_DN52834_c0_g1_i1.p1 TRINITY_DN52834_c0_g1~~TRINITY_DN52834_c0_g1_i1.p1  ORF type:complete len:103 (+),score=4.69 TRINITY_DN52834_c0_g1_i1:134-442(+)